MAFLDNSGDIVLDAVLTEVGRRKLALGDGSFRITKFSLGDDELDYNLYNLNHTSGSFYAGLNILQTPILQASTDNKVGLKHPLVSMTNYTTLYLPNLKINTNDSKLSTATGFENTFVVVSTKTAADAFNSLHAKDGLLDGTTTNAANDSPKYSIVIDQGINKAVTDTGLTFKDALSAELDNQQFSITMDNRLLRLVTPNGGDAPFSQVSNTGENLATYIVSPVNAASEVNNFFDNPPTKSQQQSVFNGPRGTRLLLNLAAQPSVQASLQARTDLGFSVSSGAFAALGGSITGTDAAQIKTTTVSVRALQTGAELTFRVTVLAHNTN